MTLAKEIIYGSLERVESALRKEEHVNFIDEYGYTPLIEAAIVNDIEKARLIIQHKADLNWTDLTGGTALHWAVDNYNLKLCQLLLENGANPNAYTLAGQPALVKPILRNQADLKKLLIQHGANLTFALDFIYTKLIGHLFELISSADVVDSDGNFTQVEFEGFFLEFTVELVNHSFRDYRNNYAARSMRPTFRKLNQVIKALSRSAQLIKYQQYLTDISQHQEEINELLSTDPLIIPISQEGHAITVVKAGNLLAVCDRAKYQDKPEDIVIYYMNKPWKLTPEWMQDFIYKKQPLDIFHKVFPYELGLQPIASLPISPQQSGNCTWANVEACLPVLFYMLSVNDPRNKNDADPKQMAMDLFYEWREWEKTRSLNFFMNEFHQASPARKASKAAVLGSVLFQCCLGQDKVSQERAMKIIPLLKTKGYEYVLQSYIEIYYNRKRTPVGEELLKLLDYYERIYC